MEEQVQSQPTPESKPEVTKTIVIFGKHDYIVKNAQTLLEKGNYTVVGFVELEMASMYLVANPFDMLFFVGSVDPHDRLALKAIVDKDFPNAKILDHFGGPATILTEVNEAFN